MPEVLAAPARNRGLACIRVSGPTAVMVCATLADRGMVCVDAEEPGVGEYTLRRAGGTAIVAWREEREEPPPRPPKPPRAARPPRKRTEPRRTRVRSARPPQRPRQPRAPRGLAWLDEVPHEFAVPDVLRARPGLSYWSAAAQVLELRRAGLVGIARRVITPDGWRPVVYRRRDA